MAITTKIITTTIDDDDDFSDNGFDEDSDEMEELWEEVVHDDDEADYHDEEDDEIMEEDDENLLLLQQQQLQEELEASFQSLVDRPAEIGRHHSSLDSLDEEDSAFAASSAEPSRHGMVDKPEGKPLWDTFDEDDDQNKTAVFSGGPLAATNGENNSYGQDPFESTDAWGSIKEEAGRDNDFNFDMANQLPPSSSAGPPVSKPAEVSDDEASHNGENPEAGPKVEKWLERNADDPDDYDYACRRLIQILYKDDEDHDPDTMMRRTTAQDLYKYLKQEYWYLVHTGQLDEATLDTDPATNGEADKTNKQQQSLSDIDKRSPKPSKETLLSVFTQERLMKALSGRQLTEDDEAQPKSQQDDVVESTVELDSNPNLEEGIQSEKEDAQAIAADTETENVFTTDIPQLSENQDQVENGDQEFTDLPQKREFDNDDDLSETRNKKSKIDTKDDMVDSQDDGFGSESGAEYSTVDEEDLLQQERFERYTKEYNEMLDMQDDGEDVDEDRLYFLELAVRQRLGEDLTESELLDLEDFDGRELNVQDTEASPTQVNASQDNDDHSTGSAKENIELPNVSDERSPSVPDDDNCSEHSNNEDEKIPKVYDEGSASIPDDKDGSEHSRSLSGADGPNENNLTISTGELDAALNTTNETNDTMFSFNESDKDKSFDVETSKEEEKPVEPDPAELEWRKKKLEDDLIEIVQRAEEEELDDLMPNEAIVALKIATSKVAFTKKYYDAKKDDYIYFPSVAKVMYDYVLIEEAEKYYKDDSDEFPFEYSNALCAIAATLIDDIDEVDDQDDYIMNMAVDVCLGDDDKEGNVELAMRRSMIEEELETLLLDAEQQELEDTIDPDIVAVLKKGAMEAAYIKKYFEMKKDKYVYFPSVAKSVYNFSMIEAAEKYLTNGEEEICLDYTNALCTIAASYLKGDIKEVDEDDVLVKTTAVYVDLGDGVNRNLPSDSSVASLSLGGDFGGGFDEASEKSEKEVSGTGDNSQPFQLGFGENSQGFESQQNFDEPFNGFGSMDDEPFNGFGGMEDFNPDSLMSGDDGDDDQEEGEEETPQAEGNVDETENGDEYEVSEPEEEKDTSEDDILEEENDAMDNNEEGPVESEDKKDMAEVDDEDFASEPEMRRSMISRELDAIVKEAEEKELEECLQKYEVDALRVCASRVAFVKKYLDVTTDKYVYYPSVAKTIVNYSLFEEIDRLTSTKTEASIQPEHASALRAIAAEFLKKNDIDETNDYIVNMTVDVDFGTHDENLSEALPTEQSTEEEKPETEKPIEAENEMDSPVVEIEYAENVEASSDAEQSSEKDYLLQLLYEEFDRVIKEAEENELEEPLEEEALIALKAASKNVCYKKKFYDVLNDQCIYFPSVVRTIIDYSLLEEAEKLYFNGEEEFPMEYASGLRAVACAAIADDDLDYDYMDMVALPVPALFDEDGNGTSEVQPDVEEGTDEPESSEQDLAKTLPPTEEANGSSTNEAGAAGGTGDVDENMKEDATEKVSDEVEDLAPVHQHEEMETCPLVEDDTTGVEEVGVADTKPSPASPSDDEVLRAITIEDNDQNEEEINEALEDQKSSVVIDKSQDAIQSVPSELTTFSMDEDEGPEEARLKEMAEILEFKRRVDKQKLSDDAKSLQEMKKKGQLKVEEDLKALDDEIRTAESRLNEEASLLSEKWLDDEKKIDRALQELESTRLVELKRIEDELQSLDKKRLAEQERIEKETKDIEDQRVEDEANYPQRLQSVREDLANAISMLESERKEAEEAMKAEDHDEESKEEKSRGFFGFGGRSKKNDVEKEKQKQAKFMEFKLREMELEKQVEELENEQTKIKDQSKARERERVERLARLDEDLNNLEKTISELEVERKEIETSFIEEKATLQNKRVELQETRKDDEAWLASEKEKLQVNYREGKERIARSIAEQRVREQEEEERLNRNAMILKERWVKEEASYSLEVQAFERSKGERKEKLSTDAEQDHVPDEPASALWEYEESEGKAVPSPESSLEADNDNQEMESSITKEEDSSVHGQEEPTEPETLSQADNVNEEMQSSMTKEDDGSVHGQEEPTEPETSSQADNINEEMESLLTKNDDQPDLKPLGDNSIHIDEAGPENGASMEDVPDSDSEEPLRDDTAIDDGSKKVPDHLVVLNQPKKSESEHSRSSIRSIEVFDPPAEKTRQQKPLLAAAMKAKEAKKMNASLSVLEMVPTIEREPEEVMNKSVPEHLLLANQPKSLFAVDSNSMRSLDVFDSASDEPKPAKPLLAAALKAKGDQMAKSFSVLEGLPPISQNTKDDLSKSVPNHLSMINQPKFAVVDDDQSIGELDDVFDPPSVDDPDAIPNKPLLSAAYKAKKEQFSKSFCIGDFAFSAVEKDTSIHDDFSRSVPSNLIAIDAGIEFRPSRVASDKIKAMPTPLEDDDEKPCEALKEVQTDVTPRRKKKQGVGLGSRLLQEAITFKENSLNDSSSLVPPDDADDNVKADPMSPSKEVSKSQGRYHIFRGKYR